VLEGIVKSPPPGKKWVEVEQMKGAALYHLEDAPS